MSEARLQKWHEEAIADDMDLLASIRVMRAELEEPTRSERSREEIRRRIGHLMFEVTSRLEQA